MTAEGAPGAEGSPRADGSPSEGRRGDAEAGAASVVQVRAGAGDYPVVVAPGAMDALADLLARHAPAHCYAILADDRVAALHGARVQEAVAGTGRPLTLHTFPAGEGSKTRATWEALTDVLLTSGVGRDGCVLALGGGVTGDLAGFVAATYLRGIPVVQLPTSLVAMVDSAVGGKTGVDVPAGKNLVGAFHPPRLVVADPVLAMTLPRGERSQGLAEAVKHGAIVEAAYLERVVAEAEALLAGEVEATARMVRRSVEIKADVVSRDEREGGLRQILNFGHTLGHALEAASGYRIPHGDAVARGMVLEARLGVALGCTDPETPERLARAVRAVGLPAEGPLPASPGEIVAWARTDKKVRAGRLRFVLLAEVGQVAPDGDGRWSHAVEEAEVLRLLETCGGPPGV